MPERKELCAESVEHCKEKIILWGSGNIGNKAYEKLKENYDVVAFGDNDIYRQGLSYKGIPIIGYKELEEKYKGFKVIVALADYYDEAQKLSSLGYAVMGYYDAVQEKIFPWKKISWDDVKKKTKVRLYAGDIYSNFEHYPDDFIICLSLTNSNYRCIQHDITMPYPLESNSIDSYQIEDVIEHIEFGKTLHVLNEIYRILKAGGYLRLSLPDYHSPRLLYRSLLDREGKPVYDPGGGGRYVRGKVCEGGHVWFPTFEMVKGLLEWSDFKNYRFYRYYDELGYSFAETIDYDMGYISRTKEHTVYGQDTSIVVDCYK